MKSFLQHFTLSALFVMLNSGISDAQQYFFYVQLTDKNNSPYALDRPSDYLSERAIERRAYFNIPVDSTDLPLNPDYVSQIQALGITVHCTTKWLNALTVRLNDSSHMAQVRALPFVKWVEYTGKGSNAMMLAAHKIKAAEIDYGVAATQINNMNGNVLHQNGFKGEGIHVAVIDAGFNSVNTNPAFQLLRDEDRLLGTKDFVNPASDIFSENTHGAYVFSTMAAENNGVFVGTAPKASYLLIRTEDAAPEYPYEPDFWISGIEYADSAGVDIATSSLGYTTFDDASMNYTYEDMDGATTRITIAANMAYSKGILIFNSAGNDGNKTWQYIGAPADAPGVIAVGSVSKDSIPSSFSSFGPSADGRIKPELCAIGYQSAFVATGGNLSSGNGTSYATPILAGLAACYLQASKAILPYIALDELRTNLFTSGHLHNNPTNQMGYGIPDFDAALGMLHRLSTDLPKDKKLSTVQKIRFIANTPVKIHIGDDTGFEKAFLYSLSGVLCGEFAIEQGEITINSGFQAQGLYILRLAKK